ncbi:MAG TPA: sensor histidine kinase [Galbitalea sp.]|jgi:signal transduction histidine kinase
MTESRWWTLAVAVTVVGLSVLVLVDGHSVPRAIGSIAAAVALGIVWVLLGRRALTSRPYGLIVAVLFILLASVGVGFASEMATIQCIAFPVIWTVLDRTRTAIVANVALALGVALGFYVSLGGTTNAIAVGGTIEGISLVFSLALGLWITSISEKSEERKRLIDQLELAQGQVAALSRDAGASGERERLAREIHDTIAQDLTGLVLTAQRGLRELKAGNTAAAENQLGVLEENARHALSETRALVASGAAVGVDGGGLATALRRLAERFERETGITVTVSADDTTALDRDSEVVLLRCAQEALANVRKHSTAKAAAVALAVREGRVELSITDDGTGFDPTAEQSGFGLAGLRDRLALVRGTLAVTASPGGGTMLVASLPAAAGVSA